MKPVVKIGGSLLRSAADFVQAARFVAAYSEPPVVVVSAVKGVTDLLLQLEKTRSYLLYEELAHRHISIARGLGVEERIAPLLKELEYALRLPHAPWSADYFASFGERLSATMLHAVLEKMGIEAKLFIAPMLTDSNYGNAEPIALEHKEEMSRPDAVAVVTGFIGRDKEGRFTTVGRGGSDYTATYIGKELGARKVSLVTDSPGVMTADPREVQEAYVLPLLSVQEAVEAAKVGAKNFHPRTFIPVVEAGRMAVEVRSYNSRGTLIAHIYPPPPYKIVVRCGQGSCVVGLAAYELTKLGGTPLGQYSVKLNIPPRQVHEHLILPYIKYINT
ncbi:amino acid kinase family protein [Pyrobaculum aerophilum]|uniref:Aspartate kinase n=1 Tax=Pyrobaculum aerophilum TaxID=13773 RepID=A0A371R7D1_9CREN|nr:aspartate kinase [Pyrobaculum aerophilum]RFA98340.1 aspartate kinase [Pyrobaculum aerophilum]RFB00436.1 aspartate kinase [Pyrobaculum aerophilum]